MACLLRQIAVVVLFLCLSFWTAPLDARDDYKEAEKVAQSYMTALFEGDVKTAARLTHTDTLQGLKSDFLEQLDEAEAGGSEGEFLEEIGIEMDAGKLRSMSPVELYVTLMESGRKKAGMRPREAKKVEVKVEGSERAGKDEVSVRLKAIIPTDKGPVTKAGGLLLSKEGSAWRVRSDLGVKGSR